MDGWMDGSEREGDSESDHMTPCTVGRPIPSPILHGSLFHAISDHENKDHVAWVAASILVSRLTFNLNLTFADQRSLLF